MSVTKTFKKNKKTFIIVALSSFLVACLIIANYLSLYIIKTNNKSDNVTNSGFDIYMLSLSKSKVEKEAKSIASDFQEIGAGGYIWKQDDYYHVIASAYINKNDAELVKNSIKINQNIDSEIFTVSFPSFSINGTFSVEEKKVVKKAISVSQTFYTSIYDIAVSLDTGVINEISAKLSVNSTNTNIATIYANLDTLYHSPIKSPMKELSTYTKKILDISQLLATDEKLFSSQTYSSHLKYRYLQALNEYLKYVN